MSNRSSAPTRTVVKSRGRVEVNASGESDARGLALLLDLPRPMPALDLVRLQRWLGVRLPGTVVEVTVGKVAP